MKIPTEINFRLDFPPRFKRGCIFQDVPWLFLWRGLENSTQLIPDTCCQNFSFNPVFGSTAKLFFNFQCFRRNDTNRRSPALTQAGLMHEIHYGLFVWSMWASNERLVLLL